MTLNRLIDETARKNPERVAIEGLSRTVTYGELIEHSKKLAQYLSLSGVVPGDIVGLSLGREPELIISVLGILKAGAAYMPMDANFPPTRTAKMLSQANIKIILTTDTTLSTMYGARVILFPTLTPSNITSELPSTNKSSALACLLFTSGSTGDPKGIMLSHDSIVSYVYSVQSSTPLGPHDRVLQFATVSFDAFAEEVFPCLARGATLVLMPRPQEFTLRDFITFCDNKKITFMVLTTGYWNTFVNELATDPTLFPSNIRTIVFGGERAQRRWVNLWCRIAPPSVRLINAYGPTETTVAVTHYEVPRDFQSRPGNGVPVGRPLRNAQVQLLNNDLTEVEQGAIGEVFIGGPCVSNGYINNDKLNKAKFVLLDRPDGVEERFYRTGDLARIDQDGEIEIIGRTDDQIKIRGFLVEPAEVERVLDGINDIKGAAVKMWPAADGLGADVLVAYVLVSDTEKFENDAVREGLRSMLPDYMVPSHIIAMTSFPLTPIGKVDREALPPPNTAIKPTEKSTSDVSSLEDYLSTLWCDLIGLDDIELDENFFEVGGHSLLAARMVGQVQKLLGSTIYMVAIFEFPTVRLFANYLRKNYQPNVNSVFKSELIEIEDVASSDIGSIDAFRSKLISFLKPRLHWTGVKNPKAIFLLSPPRSGSTLTRILLGGHPDLFAPPELQLSLFDNLEQRDRFFKGRRAFYLEGALRALMEAKKISFDDASSIVDELKASGATTAELYRCLQEAVAPALLVDKTTSYALDPQTLSQIELQFENPFYIHLVRHPVATITSYIETRQDQGSFFYEHNLGVNALAELVWLVSHQNLLGFLDSIPKDRVYQLHYEALVAAPEKELRSLCTAIGLPFVPEMLNAYDHQSRRMTDPARPGSLMVGDTKFHEHKNIEKEKAKLAKGDSGIVLRIRESVILARKFGYTLEQREECDLDGATAKPSTARSLVTLKSAGNNTPIFMVHGSGGSVQNFRYLSNLFADRPFYGLQAPGLDEGGELYANLSELAEFYIKIIRSKQPTGPYIIAGWSFGGIAAWEIAQQLRKNQNDVALLVTLDSFPPEHFETDETSLVLRFGHDFCVGLGQFPPSIDRESLADIQQDELTRHVLNTLCDRGAVDRDTIEYDRYHSLYRVYRSHVRSAQSYNPQEYHGRVLNLVTLESLAHNRQGTWSDFGRHVATMEVPGNHFSCLAPPNVNELAKIWGHVLREGQ